MKVLKKDVSLPRTLGEYAVGMSADDAGELRVLIYILSSDDALDTCEIAEALSMSDSEVDCAVAFWRGAGLITNGKSKQAKKKEAKDTEKLPDSVRDTETRSYSGTEIAKILESKPEMNSLLKFAQDRLGKVFSPSDISKLVYLVDYILLTPPMVMRIIEYCAELEKKSMRYVEKTAISIYDEGICSYEALEEYFDAKRKRSSRQGIVKSIMGLGERNLTGKEATLVDRWFDEFGASRELIALAYEKTIANTSKPSIPYMSKILEKWYADGLKTPEDVENGKTGSPDENGINLEHFDEASGRSIDNAWLDLDDFFENS